MKISTTIVILLTASTIAYFAYNGYTHGSIIAPFSIVSFEDIEKQKPDAIFHIRGFVKSKTKIPSLNYSYITLQEETRTQSVFCEKCLFDEGATVTLKVQKTERIKTPTIELGMGIEIPSMSSTYIKVLE